MSYEADITGWTEKLWLQVLADVAEIAREAHSAIVVFTPFDTGRAKTSWNIADGPWPDLSVAPPMRDRINPSTGDVIEKAAASATPFADRSAANAAAFEKQSKLSGLKVPIVTISNNLDYIVELEGGSSPQAPAKAMFAANVDRAEHLAQQMGYKTKMTVPSLDPF